MKIWVSKLKYSAKRIKRKIPTIVVDAFAVIGVLLTIAEGADEIFKYDGIFQFYAKYFWALLIIVLLGVVLKNWDHLKFEMKVEGSPDVKITLKVGDALANEGAVIIPTNTTFDTIMEDEFISEKSLQGQYQLKYYKKNLTGLNASIAAVLKEKKSITLNDGRKTNTSRYPIGTVARISDGKKRAYLVAEADINKQGIPVNPDASDISTALVMLWNELNEIGNMETYSIPLMGTGRAGVKNASRDEIIKEIVLSFLTASRSHKLTENLIICVHPSDFEKIHWDEICEYITYNCRYLYKNQDSNRNVVSMEEYPDTEEELQNIKNEPLTEREQKLIDLLAGNQMSTSEIASTLGVSVRTAAMMIRKLSEKGLVSVVGQGRRRKYKVTE